MGTFLPQVGKEKAAAIAEIARIGADGSRVLGSVLKTEGEERDVVDKAARDAHDEVVAAETKARAGEAATIAEGYSDATSASEEATRTRDRLDQLETGTTRLQNLIDETFAKKSSAEAARFDEVQRQIQSMNRAVQHGSSFAETNNAIVAALRPESPL